MEPIDLTDVPVVDNHCHGIHRVQDFRDPTPWRRAFTESCHRKMARDHVSTTLFYNRLLHDLATYFGCDPEEGAILAARANSDVWDLTGSMLRAADIETLVVDEGYPEPEEVLPNTELSYLSGCRVAPMLRLETLMESLIAFHDTLKATSEGLSAALADVRSQGYVALKSIAAYRTGLEIQEWCEEEAESSFLQARRTVLEEGSVRLSHKPLLDTLLHVAFVEAARQEVPVQFHVGYGDADIDLLTGNPLYLRAVLERTEYRSMPVVLLHGCYPYTREGAYLAAIYENVYLDLSYGIPFLGYAEMLELTRAAFGVAPISKLLYSSDGIGVPELHWMGAMYGRRVLGQVLGEAVGHGELDPDSAEAAGAGVLRQSAIDLYQL